MSPLQVTLLHTPCPLYLTTALMSRVMLSRTLTRALVEIWLRIWLSKQQYRILLKLSMMLTKLQPLTFLMKIATVTDETSDAWRQQKTGQH